MIPTMPRNCWTAFEHLDGTIRAAGGLMVNYSGDGGIAVFGWPTRWKTMPIAPARRRG